MTSLYAITAPTVESGPEAQKAELEIAKYNSTNAMAARGLIKARVLQNLELIPTDPSAITS